MNGAFAASSSSFSFSSSSPSFNGRHPLSTNPTLVLEPVNDAFTLKTLDLPEHLKVKIGRQTGVTTAPNPTNGYFDSKVLSRVHAEVWSEAGKVYIRDLKSSNGTFLNARRLCPENMESEPFELNQNDSLEFGIDILDEHGALLHEKVSCKIYISRISYPTPGSSPQDSHAKIMPMPFAGPGLSPVLSTPVSLGGQSENIDLIISRLQNELTRSQETFSDLGFLKHSLGELEKTILLNGNESDAKKTNEMLSVDYEKLLKQKDEVRD
ncbi:SMAD/FHA domain-containing protein [Dissophora ornata]|nr:SMAD/FHA domain-containing protein [Dissophora ornata]